MTITRITKKIAILMELLCFISIALVLTKELTDCNMHASELQYINPN